MKNGKKITAAISASAVVAAMAAPVVASASTVTFTDISGSYAQAAIQKLADAGIVHGTDGKFNPNGTINKQDFVIILVNALGLDVSNAPATPSFADVPTTSYAYKYVEAAKKAGIVHGDEKGNFGYNTNLERQQMALMFANAAGADVTGKASKNNFSDNAQIGGWAADAVGYAVEQGWIHGYDGKFDPKGSATRAQVAVVASAFLDTVNKDLKIVASATQTTIGQKVTLSVPGATNVVWSVDKNGVIDASGNFVGTAVGSATVTATVNGKTLTQVISVAGAAQTVKIQAVKDMVANGESLQTITVNAVDANGNVDTSYTGDVTITADDVTAADYAPVAIADQATDFNANTGVLTLTNGVGTFVVQSGVTPGTATTFTATFVDPTDNTVYTSQATVNAVEQVATKISLTPKYDKLAVNKGLEDDVTVQVLDQDGYEMKVGSFPVHVTVSGNGAFDNVGTVDPIDTTFTAGNDTVLSLYSLKGQAGSMTVTATSEGLTTATASIATVVAQDATKLTLKNTDTTNTTNTFAQGSGVLHFDLSTADVNGYNTGADEVVDTKTLKVFAYNADGTVASNVQFAVNGGAAITPETDGGVFLPTDAAVADGTGTNKITLDVTDTNMTADAGNYTIVVKDTNTDTTVRTLAATAATKIIESADAATQVVVTSGSTVVSSDSPSTTFTAQIADTYGNPVAAAGEQIKFTAENQSGNTHQAKLNGGIFQLAPYTTVKTDATGKATVTLTTQTYNGDAWKVTASDISQPAPGYTDGQASVTVADLPATKIAMTFHAAVDLTGSTAIATSDDKLYFGTKLVNKYGGDAAQNDTLQAVVTKGIDATALDGAKNSAGNDMLSTDANGNVVITDTADKLADDLSALVAGKAGTMNVTVKDVDNSSVAAASYSFTVKAGDFYSYYVADSTGSDVVTVAANTPVALTLFAGDKHHNRVSAPAYESDKVTKIANYSFTFSDLLDSDGSTLGNGEYRKTTNGAMLTADALTLQPGATTTVYYVNSVAGTYDLSVVGKANDVQ